MIRIGLRDARSHFGRFIMSIVAIALGVSFVVGSFCFREMLNNQVSQMMSTNADHDVYVRGSQERKKIRRRCRWNRRKATTMSTSIWRVR